MLLHHPSINIITKRWKMLVLLGLVFSVVVGLISVLFPLEYRADAQVLVISQSRYGVDPYTVIKTSELIGENLVQVIKTNDFFNVLMNQTSAQGLDKSIFENVNERTKRKHWQDMLKGSVVYGTGIVNISVYHTDANQAKKYASAVAETLSAESRQYVGGDVIVKIINEPVATNYPVRPNLLINLFIGFMVGLIFAFLLFLRRENKNY